MKANMRRKGSLCRTIWRVITGLIILASVPTPQCKAQSPSAVAPSASFDVASIKLDRDTPATGIHIHISFDQDSFTASGVTVKDLIQLAYHISDFQLSGGPSWAESEKYVVQAKMDEATVEALKKLPREQRNEQQRLMVQSLLAERFKLKLSHSSKELPVYALVLTTKGPKFSQSSGSASSNRGMNSRSGELTAGATSMSGFAEWLSSVVSRKVVDKTGLEGNYDFTLHWTRQSLVATSGAATDGGKGAAAIDDSSGPSIFTALQEQLGLKLESQKGPVEILIIDSAEKPSEN